MPEKNIGQIVKFFESINCEAEYILKNMCRNSSRKKDFPANAQLSTYVVIYTGENILNDEKKFEKKCEFENRINEHIAILNLNSFKNNAVKECLTGYGMRDYKIIYKNGN